MAKAGAKTIAILGSTGSIGTQTVEICRRRAYPVAALSCGQRVDILAEQIALLRPRRVSVADKAALLALEEKLSAGGLPREQWPDRRCGDDGLEWAACCPEADMVVGAVVGIAGLRPILAAIRAGKDIALANKEVLVAGGDLVMAESRRQGVRLLPVDSEHAAIWQCLWGNERRFLRKIYLTASGGPFRRTPATELERVTRKDALKHPTWTMGGKITIDSATMMNKGLEVIEAMHLFDVAPEQIQVLIHPQSIIHSMVEYCDGAVLAQLGFPDMALPIQLALSYPERDECPEREFNPFVRQARELTFEEPDLERFPCLALALEAANEPKSLAVIMNAANEVAVAAFLRDEILFMEIAQVVREVMEQHKRRGCFNPETLNAILTLDGEGRSAAAAVVEYFSKR